MPPDVPLTSVPTAGEPTCVRCNRGRPRGKRVRRGRRVHVHVALLESEVAEVLAAGLNPQAVLRAGWKAEMERRRPFPPSKELVKLRGQVYRAGLRLLPRHGWKGVPSTELATEAGLRRTSVQSALGGPSRPMRIGDRVVRGYPAERIMALAPQGKEVAG